MLFQPCWLTLYYRIRGFYFNSNYVNSLLVCVAWWRHWILLMSDCHYYVSTRVTLETKRSEWRCSVVSTHYMAHGCLFWNTYVQSQKKRLKYMCIFTTNWNYFLYSLGKCTTNYDVCNYSANVIPVYCHSHQSFALQLKKNFYALKILSLFLTFLFRLE